MDPKGAIFKRGKGGKATWWARVRYLDPESGKPKDLQRRAESKANAIDVRDKLLADIKATAGRSVGSERMTFGDLCDYFEKHYIKPAEYIDGRKVAGMRSLPSAKTQLATLRNHFGGRALRSITHGKIREFRSERFKAPTKAGTQRSIASVNRDLALLHKMLNVAKAEGWLIKSPFEQGASLISSADERKRERILTREEEQRLLAACEGRTISYTRAGRTITAADNRRVHLKPLIIAALDTGCRLGELLKLCWGDVDLESGQINLIAFNTKIAKARTIAMTTRLRSELERLKAQAPDDPSLLVFGILSNVKRSFTAARNEAGLPNVRFHDLRHSAATRLVQAHIPLSEVGRILGHTQANTTYRYVNQDAETARRAAAALDAFNQYQATDIEAVQSTGGPVN